VISGCLAGHRVASPARGLLVDWQQVDGVASGPQHARHLIVESDTHVVAELLSPLNHPTAPSCSAKPGP
jgi:hypothetical protein